MAPPTSVSCAFDSRAAGRHVVQRQRNRKRHIERRAGGHDQAHRRPMPAQHSALPTSTSSAGNNASSSVSSIRSTAHMPRVTRRTMEPAKLFACQSVEKRCTRQKASPGQARHQPHRELADAHQR